MKKLLSLTTIAFSLGLAGLANANVTMGFSTASAKLTNLADDTGTVKNGMLWGIVVSTSNNTFAGDGTGLDRYDPFTIPAAGPSTANQIFLKVNGITTDDIFFYDDATFTTASFGGTDSGSGAVGTIDNIVYPPNIMAGDIFGIMWLSTTVAGTPTNTANNGDKYGFLTVQNPSFGVTPNANAFVMPSDPGTYTNFATNFAGADPTRSGTLTFGGSPVPEPSRLILLGLGGMGLLFRRRRC